MKNLLIVACLFLSGYALAMEAERPGRGVLTTAQRGEAFMPEERAAGSGMSTLAQRRGAAFRAMERVPEEKVVTVRSLATAQKGEAFRGVRVTPRAAVVGRAVLTTAQKGEAFRGSEENASPDEA